MARSAANRLLLAFLIGLAIVGLALLYWAALSGDTPSGTTPEQVPEGGWQPAVPPLDTAHLELVRRAVGPDGLVAMHLERYRREVGRYPDRLEELVRSEGEAPGSTAWGGPYLQNADLLNDPWGRRYQYRRAGVQNPNAYDLWSVGPDAKDATGDEIGNW